METEMKFKGCGVALITPFNSDKSIDYSALKNIIENIIKNNVDYFVLLGTTAETPTLSDNEQRDLIDFCIKKINGRKPIMIGFGGNNTEKIISDLKTFNFEGIDAILCATPHYNKPSQEGIYEHYSNISKNSPIPVLLYNVPSRTASNIDVETVLRLDKDFDNIIGIKEASGNLQNVMKIIKDSKDKFLVISGDDSLSYSIIGLGGSGVISVLANGLPKKMSSLVHLALNNKFEESKKLHFELLDLFTAISAEGNPTGIKSLLNASGTTKNNLRLPLMRASSDLSSKIKILLSNLSN